MGVEQLAMSGLAALSNRPRLTAQLFRFSKWGNPFVDERFSWPYPMYDRMRESGPITYSRSYAQWFVLGHDELQQVLRSPDTATSPVASLLLSMPRYRRLSEPARVGFARWLVTTDPPEHSRLRSAVSRAFTPKQIAAYAPLVERTADDLTAALPSSGEVDIVGAFTDRLPIHVTAEILGLPAERRSWLDAASRDLALVIEPLTPFDPATMNARFAELDAYFIELIQARRRDPGDDLISALATTVDGPSLDVDEIVAMIAFLLTAGHETITAMLGTALIALAEHPDQRDLLRSTPSIVDNAVEELLRYDPPAQVSGRQATADITVTGHKIRKGANIGLFIGAANRDTRRWPDANELRLDRPDPKGVSFGFGAHHCIGAALARLELQVALPLLVEQLGDYTVDLSRTEWKRSFSLRGPTKLPVRLAA